MRHQIVAFTGSQRELTQVCSELLRDILLESKGEHFNVALIPFLKRETDYIASYRRKVRSHLMKYGLNTNSIVITEPVKTNEEAKQIKDLKGVIIHAVCQGHENESDPSFSDLSIYDLSTIESLKQNIKYLIRDGLV